MARLQHPNLEEVIDVPDSAVGQLSMSGWVPAEGEAPPTCPTCGQVWPAYAERQDGEPPGEPQTDQEAPADAGASSSQPPKRRRKSEESEQ